MGIPNVLTTIYEEYIGDVKVDVGPKVKLNFVNLKSTVAAYRR